MLDCLAMRMREMRRGVWVPSLKMGGSRDVALQAMRLVAEQYEVEVRSLKGRSRRQPEAFARQVAMYLGRLAAGLSIADVAALYDRHPQTVWAASRRVALAREADPGFDGQVKRLIQELTGEVEDGVG